MKLPLCSVSPLRGEDTPGYAPHPGQLAPSAQGVKIPWPVELAPIAGHLTELKAERKKIMKTSTVLIIERYKFVRSLQGFPGCECVYGGGGGGGMPRVGGKIPRVILPPGVSVCTGVVVGGGMPRVGGKIPRVILPPGDKLPG